jgi:cobyrinic acid a,c-diamide synthase
VKEISALGERELPAVDALYIGGGFPETHAEYLAANWRFRKSLKEEIEKGLPVYAECAGLMFLGESLFIDHHQYPMVGVFPVTFGMEKRPQGHGYTEMEVETKNPFFPAGMTLRGHEFHYSRILGIPEEGVHFAYRVKRGVGIDGRRDGLCWRNVLASYCHLHSLATPQWADSMVQNARLFRSMKEKEGEALKAGRDG